MSDERVVGLLTDWLTDLPARAPERLLNMVIADVRRTPQRRRIASLPVSLQVSRPFMRFALAVGVVIVLAVVAVIAATVLRPTVNEIAASPTPIPFSPLPTTSSFPTPSPATSAPTPAPEVTPVKPTGWIPVHSSVLGYSASRPVDSTEAVEANAVPDLSRFAHGDPGNGTEDTFWFDVLDMNGWSVAVSSYALPSDVDDGGFVSEALGAYPEWWPIETSPVPDWCYSGSGSATGTERPSEWASDQRSTWLPVLIDGLVGGMFDGCRWVPARVQPPEWHRDLEAMVFSGGRAYIFVFYPGDSPTEPIETFYTFLSTVNLLPGEALPAPSPSAQPVTPVTPAGWLPVRSSVLGYSAARPADSTQLGEANELPDLSTFAHGDAVEPGFDSFYLGGWVIEVSSYPLSADTTESDFVYEARASYPTWWPIDKSPLPASCYGGSGPETNIERPSEWASDLRLDWRPMVIDGLVGGMFEGCRVVPQRADPPVWHRDIEVMVFSGSRAYLFVYDPVRELTEPTDIFFTFLTTVDLISAEALPAPLPSAQPSTL